MSVDLSWLTSTMYCTLYFWGWISMCTINKENGCSLKVLFSRLVENAILSDRRRIGLGSGDTWCGNCLSAACPRVSSSFTTESLNCHSSRYKLQSNLHFRYKMARCQFPLAECSPSAGWAPDNGSLGHKRALGDQVSATMDCKGVFTTREKVGHSYHEVTSTI